MLRQHAHTDPFAYSALYCARHLAAFALAAALSGAVIATPVVAQQNRPAAQQGADAPRNNPAPAGEAGARPTRQSENSPRLPADS